MKKIHEKCLRFLIREAVSDKIQLSNGRMIERGSRRYIEEIDSLISDLDFFRRSFIGNNKKRRKERYTISRAIDSLRSIRRSERKKGIKLGLLDENDL